MPDIICHHCKTVLEISKAQSQSSRTEFNCPVCQTSLKVKASPADNKVVESLPEILSFEDIQKEQNEELQRGCLVLFIVVFLLIICFVACPSKSGSDSDYDDYLKKEKQKEQDDYNAKRREQDLREYNYQDQKAYDEIMNPREGEWGR